jgi:hypothetical protein
MKYPAIHLTPFFPILPHEAPLSGCYRSLTRRRNEGYKCSPFNTLRALELSCLSFSIIGHLFSMACGLFLQNTGGGVSRQQLRRICGGSRRWLTKLHNFSAPINTFRINTSISVASKQLDLPLESTLTKKRGEGGGVNHRLRKNQRLPASVRGRYVTRKAQCRSARMATSNFV